LKVALDTSFIVNLLVPGTLRHQPTLAAYERLRSEGAELVIADHALVEAFSVLSRSPEPYRVPPENAISVLRQHFGHLPPASLAPGYSWEVIRHTLDRGYWGGRVHDAEIAMASFQAGARLLLTWNLRDFLTVAPVGLEIRIPA
jgi:predicted nucleic acid-binding protein